MVSPDELGDGGFRSPDVFFFGGGTVSFHMSPHFSGALNVANSTVVHMVGIGRKDLSLSASPHVV